MVMLVYQRVPAVFGACDLRSDSLSQSIAPEQMDLDHDWARTGRMVSYGVFFYAGLALKWYDAGLEKCVATPKRCKQMEE